MKDNLRKKSLEDRIWNGLVFDSKEEIQFYKWCSELKDASLILDFEYQPMPFLLSDTVRKDEVYSSLSKKKASVLLKSHVYTADFKIVFSDKFIDLFGYPTFLKYFYPSSSDPYVVYVDIKGNFNKFSGDRILAINQKWVYQTYKAYINKIVPDDLFRDTFLPVSEFVSPIKKKIREKYRGFKTLKDVQGSRKI